MQILGIRGRRRRKKKRQENRELLQSRFKTSWIAVQML